MTAKQVLLQRAREQRVTAEFVRHKFIYNPKTGIFTKRHTEGGLPAGTQVGKQGSRGYINLKLSNKLGWYRAHRIAWLYMTSKWPKGVVDHIDRNKANNRWVNLRDTDQSTNCLNCERSDRVAARALT